VTALDTVALVGVGGPDSVAGYALTPEYQRWLDTAPSGALVSVFERNAIVAQLSWAQSMLARPPAAVRRLPNGVPFPFEVSRSRELVLGAPRGDYQPGDVVLPQARPGGAAAVAPGSGSATGGAAATTATVTDAQRRGAFDACEVALAYLRLQPGQLVLVPGANPGGLTFLVAGVIVAVAGIAAVAGYNAVVQARAVEAGAATQQVRIREDARVAQVVAQTNAQTNALAQRLAFAQQTGTLPPPSPIEATPVQLPRVEGRPPPSTFDASVLILPAAYAGAGALALGWVKWREYQTRRAVRTLGYGR
jgi:hypothetical protein